jgi:hypothetical protein
VFLDAGQQQRKFDVLGCRKDRNEIERLKDETHLARTVPRALLVRELVDAESLDQNPAVVDVIETRDAVEQACLARAGRAHHREEFASWHDKVEALEGNDGVSPRAIDLSNTFGHQDRLVRIHHDHLQRPRRLMLLG